MNTNFNIEKTVKKLEDKGKYYCKEFGDWFKKNQKNWVFIKPVNIHNEKYSIEINVTFNFKDGWITFTMPLYDRGKEGLIGDNIAIFDSLLHQLNSRINGGYFSKYTYDESYAPIFIYQATLKNMNSDWFEEILDHFVNSFIFFRPKLDSTIEELNLKFNRKAGRFDSANKEAKSYIKTLPKNKL